MGVLTYPTWQLLIYLCQHSKHDWKIKSKKQIRDQKKGELPTPAIKVW